MRLQINLWHFLATHWFRTFDVLQFNSYIKLLSDTLMFNSMETVCARSRLTFLNVLQRNENRTNNNSNFKKKKEREKKNNSKYSYLRQLVSYYSHIFHRELTFVGRWRWCWRKKTVTFQNESCTHAYMSEL